MVVGGGGETYKLAMALMAWYPGRISHAHSSLSMWNARHRNAHVDSGGGGGGSMILLSTYHQLRSEEGSGTSTVCQQHLSNVHFVHFANIV